VPPEPELLILADHVLTMDSCGSRFSPGGVAVRGSEIAAVGGRDELLDRFGVAEVVEASGRLVMPGLVNVHCHGADALFRGLIDDLPLEPWLERLWEVEKRFLNPESVRLGSTLAYAELIRGGVTTALDMFWFGESVAKAAREVGFRVMTGPCFFDSPEVDGLDSGERLRRGRELIERLEGDPLVTPCLMPHATYTVSPETMIAIRDLAEELDVAVTTHLSETRAEVEGVVESYGCRPPEHLDRLGLLGPRTVLAHCVHLDESEMGLLAGRRSSVAHCPLSNLKLGSGMAPVPEMLGRGVRLGLATDGPVSGNDLDMWLAMRLAATLHKGRLEDPSVLAAREVVELATRAGAEALGMGDGIGSLEPGKHADLITIDLGRPHVTPLFDPVSHLAYAVGRADVESVMIHGRWVMRDRELLTVDEAATIGAVRELASRIAAESPS
jgi:5-methylthioadenosine/S-adenosylhomocysteine deaminase